MFGTSCRCELVRNPFGVLWSLKTKTNVQLEKGSLSSFAQEIFIQVNICGVDVLQVKIVQIEDLQVEKKQRVQYFTSWSRQYLCRRIKNRRSPLR